MLQGFSRQEVLSLTGLKSGNLSYWDKTGLVVPLKIGNSKHPTVLYSFEQVLQLKVIGRLREKLSLQEIRKVLDSLKERGYKPSLFTCHLVLVGKDLFFIEDWEDFGKTMLQISGKNKGQLVLQEVGVIGNVVEELQREAVRQEISDFPRRATLDGEYQIQTAIQLELSLSVVF